jgi:hypothetical protein
LCFLDLSSIVRSLYQNIIQCKVLMNYSAEVTVNDAAFDLYSAGICSNVRGVSSTLRLWVLVFASLS